MTKISSPPSKAAGAKAVKIATQKVLKVMPLGKAFKILGKLNQKHGIDCPGCAWPDPANRSKLGEFCENGAKTIAEEAMSTNVDASFFANYSLNELEQKSDYWLGQQGRLAEPVIKRKDSEHYEPVDWEEAYQLVANHLQSLNSPDEAVFYTSGRTSNEAAFLYQLFVRKFGTNNLPDCSNMCHESSGVGLNETLGIGKGSVTLEDFDQAEVILVFGQNPGTNHPRMLSSLEKAKKNGAKIITINPLKEIGLEVLANPQKVSGLLSKSQTISDSYLQIHINEDVALLKAWMKILMEKVDDQSGVLDEAFITERTSGFQEFKKDLQGQDLNALISRTGLNETEICKTANWLASSSKIIACWAMGLTQHVNAVDNIREIVNLLLMKGSIGKPGAGTCPVRGHSNVQGDRTMGIYERPTKAWTAKLRETFNFDPPESPGFNVVETIEAMNQNKVKFFMSMGGNFLPAAPDTDYTRKGLETCEITVHVSAKLNRTHLATGDIALILPCLGRTDKHIQASGEQFVTVENSLGVVHTSHGALNPASDKLRSEPEIIGNIAAATLPPDDIDWKGLTEDYDKIRDLIAKAISGFEDYNSKIKNANGFELPNGPRQGQFTTPDQKAHFTINQLSERKLPNHAYTLMTIRSHDQFNTTIYGLDDRYRGISNGRMVLFMNEQDIEDEGLNKSDIVTLFNHYDGQKRSVDGFEVVPFNIPKGCLAAYFPEANPLVPLRLHARRSHTPASKSNAVNVKKMSTS